MIDASINVIFRHQRVRCAEPCHRKYGEGCRAYLIRGRRLDNRVSRPRRAQTLSVLGHRLDVDTLPAFVEEGLTHRINVGILCTNVDVKASLNITQCPIQHDIFKVLRGGLKRLIHGVCNTRFIKSPSAR